MSKTNTRLMKLFWLIEDGANADAIMEFLSRTARDDFKRRQRNERPPSQQSESDDDVPF